MRRKSLVAAVAIGFLTFALSLASVTKAQAECKEFGPSATAICPQGWTEKGPRSVVTSTVPR